VVADARIKNADASIKQDKFKIKIDDALLEKMTLKAPADLIGTWIVTAPANPNQMLLKGGEIADGSGARCIRIVRIDPLWIDVTVPLADATKINLNDSAQVTFGSDNLEVGGKVT